MPADTRTSKIVAYCVAAVKKYFMKQLGFSAISHGWFVEEVIDPMKKLLSLLFAFAMVFSLATPVLAQPDHPPKGQSKIEPAKKVHEKKKHHKKKHKHLVVVNGQGSVKCALSNLYVAPPSWRLNDGRKPALHHAPGLEPTG